MVRSASENSFSQGGSSIGGSSVAGSSVGGTTVDDGGAFASENDKGGFSSRRSYMKVLEKGFAAIIGVPCAAWENTYRFAVIYQFLDHLQLVFYALLPFWRWSFRPASNVALHWLFRIGQIQWAAAERGIGSLLVLQYACGLLTVLNAAFLGYVIFMSRINKPVNKVLLRFGRLPIVLISQLFSLCVSALFLTMVGCDYNGRMGPNMTYLYFPDKKCYANGNIIHAATGVIFFLLHMLVALLAAFRYTEANIGGALPNHVYGGNWLVQKMSARYLLAIVSHLVVGYRPELASFIVAALALWMLVIAVVSLPYGSRGENAVSIGVHTMFLYITVILFIKESIGRALPHHQATVALAAGFAPTFFLGVGFYFTRSYLLTRTFRKFLTILSTDPEIQPDTVLDQILLRKWHEPVLLIRNYLGTMKRAKDSEATPGVPLKGTAEEEATIDFICKVALSAFENETMVHLAVASVRIFHLTDAQGGHNQAEGGGKKAKNLVERLEFYLFQKKVKRTATSTEETADLNNYLEFATNFKMILRLHKKTLSANRRFWMQLMHKEVKMANLSKLVIRLRDMTDKTDTQYRQLIELFPRSVGLLRSYARFLEECKLDMGAAHRYLSEADKLEEKIMTSSREAAEGGNAANAFQAALTDLDGSSQAVIMIDPSGIMVYVNKALCSMFGYRIQDLTGKLINVLMPMPFNKEHGSYLKNYAATGEAKILDNTRDVVAIHRDRFVFPITLHVRKVVSQGQIYFMGVMDKVEMDDNACYLWLSPTGTIVIVGQTFEDLTGWKYVDVVGKSFSTLLDDHAALDKIVDMASSMKFGEEGSDRFDLKVNHHFSTPLNAKCSLKLAGTENVTLIGVTLFLDSSSSRGVFSINSLGHLTYGNAQFSRLLGYSPKEIPRLQLMQLVPEPYGMMHIPWLKGENLLPSHGTDKGVKSCVDGRIVEMKAKSGRTVTVRLHVRSTSGEARREGKTWDCTLSILDSQAAALSYRTSLRVNASGAISDVSGTEESFGYNPATLRGADVSDALDLPSGELAVQYIKRFIQKQDVVYRRLTLKTAEGSMGPGIARFAAAAGEDGMALIECYNPSRLEGMIICERHGDGKLVEVDLKACAIFGYDKDSLVNGRMTAKALLNMTSRVDSLLVDENAKKGGLKVKHLGPPKSLEAEHADGETVCVSVLCSVLKHDRLALYITIENPTATALPDMEPPPKPSLGRAEAKKPAAVKKDAPVAFKPGRAVVMQDPRYARPAAEEDSETASPRRGVRRARRPIHPLDSDEDVPAPPKVKTARAVESTTREKDLSPHDHELRPSQPEPRPSYPDARPSQPVDEAAFNLVQKRIARFGPDAADAAEESDPDVDSDDESLEGHSVKAGTLKWVEETAASQRQLLDETNAEPASPVPLATRVDTGAAASNAGPTGLQLSMADMTIDKGAGMGMGAAASLHGGDLGTEELQDKENSQHTMATEAEKTKRYHRLLRVIDTPRAREGLNRLKIWGGIIAVGIIVIAQVIQYAVLTQSASRFANFIKFASDSGAQGAVVYRILTAASKMECYGRGYNGCTSALSEEGRATLLSQADKLEALSAELYLGKGTGLKADTPALKSLYDTPWMSIYTFDNGIPKLNKMPLFDASNTVVSSARSLAFLNSTTDLAAMVDSSPYRYLEVNGPDAIIPAFLQSAILQLDRGVQEVRGLEYIFKIFIAIGPFGVVLGATIFLLSQMHRVQVERHRAFAGFKQAPMVDICALAQRSTKLDADDDGDDDGDDEDSLVKRAAMSAAAAADRKRKKEVKADAEGVALKLGTSPEAAAAELAKASKDKRFLSDRSLRRVRTSHTGIILQMIAPIFPSFFALTLACVVVCYQFMLMNTDTLYLMESQALEQVALTQLVYRAQRVMSEANAAELLVQRSALLDARKELVRIHDVNVYGDSTLKVKGDNLKKMYYFNNYYREGCMRVDKENCVPPDNHWYQILFKGLDTSILYAAEAAGAIGVDVANTQGQMNARILYLLQAGGHDLEDGIQRSINSCLANGSYIPIIKAFQMATLIICVAGAFMYFVIVLRPYMKSVQVERKMICMLLAEFPKTHDVEGPLLDSFFDPANRQHSRLRRFVHWWYMLGVVLVHRTRTREQLKKLEEAFVYFRRKEESDSDSDDE